MLLSSYETARESARESVREWWVDFLTLVLAAGRWIGMWFDSYFTVVWDPLGKSEDAIRIRGRCKWSHFRVIFAGSMHLPQPHLHWNQPQECIGLRRDDSVCSSRLNEYHRRVVSWFYRWHDAPNEADWKSCISRFGLERVPEHGLEVLDGLDELTETAEVQPPSVRKGVRVKTISFAAELLPGYHTISVIEWNGRYTAASGVRDSHLVYSRNSMGSLCPDRMIKELDHLKKE